MSNNSFSNYITEKQTTELISSPYSFYDSNRNQYLEGNSTFNIITESSTEKEVFSAVILLHGDDLGSESMTQIKRELLRLDFMVVAMEIDEYEIIETLVSLNQTVDYLLTRPDVNKSSLGVIGHSRGGEYAILLGIMREEIHYIVGGNFRATNILMNDIDRAARFDDRFINWSDNLNNLLLINNLRDNRYYDPADYFWKSINDGTILELDVLYGDLSNESARYFIMHNTQMSHVLMLFDFNAIYEATSWAHNATYAPPSLHPNGEHISKEDLLLRIKKDVLNALLFRFGTIIASIVALISIFYSTFAFQDFLLNKSLVPLYYRLTEKMQEQRNKPKFFFKNQHSEYIRQLHEQDKKARERVYQKIDPETFPLQKAVQLNNIGQRQRRWMSFWVMVPFWAFNILTFALSDVTYYYRRTEKVLIVIKFFPDYIEFKTDSYFVLQNIFLWMALMFIVYKLVIERKVKGAMKREQNFIPLHKYSGPYYLKGILYSFEILFITKILLKIPINYLLGLDKGFPSLRNFTLSIVFLYFFNIYLYEFWYHFVKEKKHPTLHLYLVEFLFFFPFFVPDFFFPYFPNELLYGLLFLLIINPILYRSQSNMLTVTFTDYILALIIFTAFYL